MLDSLAQMQMLRIKIEMLAVDTRLRMEYSIESIEDVTVNRLGNVCLRRLW